MFSISENIEYIKEHGLMSLLKARLTRFFFVYEEWLLISLSIGDVPPEVQPSPNITIRRATLADVDKLSGMLIKHHYLRSKKQLSKWIEKDYYFFLAIAEGKIVSYLCIAPEATGIASNIIKAVNFKDTDTWAVDAFVLPEYRGNKIYSTLKIEIIKCLEKVGYRRVFGLVLRDNFSARAAYKRIGYKPVLYVTVFKLLFHRMMGIKS